MTRKHFISLARMLKRVEASNAMIYYLADWCSEQNLNFNREQFLAACKKEGGEITTCKA